MKRVHDEKQWIENGALGNTAGGGIEGRESVLTSYTGATATSA